jgi:hypothetical protein
VEILSLRADDSLERIRFRQLSDKCPCSKQLEHNLRDFVSSRDDARISTCLTGNAGVISAAIRPPFADYDSWRRLLQGEANVPNEKILIE